nr:hypothetical protein [Tanacetum cinerariifolium]
MTSITSLCEMACTFVQKKLEEKQLEEERAAKAQNWKLPVCHDDEERSNSLDENIISRLPPFSAITPDEPVLSTEEPDNSLSIGDEHLDTISATESEEFIKSSVENLILIPSESEGDEHLDTILAMESDEFIKSSVENLIPIPSESKGIPDHMCDVPSIDNSPPLDVSKDQIEEFSESNEEFSSTDDDSFSFDNIDYVEASPPDSELVSSEAMEIVIPESASTSLNSLLEETNNFNNSLPEFTTFSNVLCDAECESDFSDDQLCSDEDVLEKIVLKPLSEKEIIPMKSMRTHDSSLPISSKIDSLLEEFADELTLLKSILPGIDKIDCDFEEDIRLIEKLLYDNSSSHPPKEFVSVNSDAKIKSFSPSPILIKDSDSIMEEIDLFCTLDYPMPPSIVDKDYDFKRDIIIPKDLPSNNSLSFAEKESFDDQSCSDEDVLETIVSKPLSEEEIIPMKSLRTHDSSLPISSKIDSFLDEFAGKLTLPKSILSGIDKTDCDFEEDIHLIEKFLYDNSSSRPPKEFVSANSDAKIKSFSPSPILVKDSDSIMEEIDLFCTPDYLMSPSIVDKDYDSERDILIPKDLPSNNSLSFAEKEFA